MGLVCPGTPTAYRVGRYVARNVRGGSISVGTGSADFTPVELLLAAIASCTAIDVDVVTSRRAEPSEFSVKVTGDKVRDESGGSRMVNLSVELTVTFPDSEGADAAREALPRAVRMSHDRICTVSRTVELGTQISTTVNS